MRTRSTVLLTAALAAGAVAAVAVPGSGAGAATSCVVWGSMPRHLHLSDTHGATLRMTLRTSGCSGVAYDDGATAYLRGPHGTQARYEEWSNSGDTETETFYATIDKAGTYRLDGSRIELYNADFERIDARWSSTSVRVG